MKTICPNCGCEHDCGHEHKAETKIIDLQKKLHFNIDLAHLRAAFDQAWRDGGAVKVSTREVASRAGISEQHTRRGLIVLEARGEIKRRGAKAGWLKLERFERSAV